MSTNNHNNGVIVQFVGFEAKERGREYTFTVRETATEPREFTLLIPIEAFNSRKVRFQEAVKLALLDRGGFAVDRNDVNQQRRCREAIPGVVKTPIAMRAGRNNIGNELA